MTTFTELRESFWSSQFHGYMAVSMALYLGMLFVVLLVDLSPVLAYVAGFGVAIPIGYVRGRFADIHAEQGGERV